MASSNVTYQKVSLKYGIFVGIAHIVYFLLMGILGLHHVVELSFLSALFLIVGIVMAISNFKRAKNGKIEYLQGLAIGATTGVVSSSLLALFMVLYISVFDASYIANMQASSLFPASLSVLALFVLTIIYGSLPGFFIAFIAMQWFKRPDHTMSEQIK
jgi:hypothetical protein